MQTLKEDIKNNKLKNIYVLYGEESYMIKFYKNKLSDMIIAQGLEINKTVISDKDLISEGLSQIDVYPFMSDKRLIIFDRIDAAKNFNEKQLDMICKLPSYCYIIFIENSVDKRLKFYKKLSKMNAFVEFARQDEKTLKYWIVQQLEAVGIKIKISAVESLLELTGNDMNTIYNEVQKLISYCDNGKIISVEDVHNICSRSLKSMVFDMIGCAVSGNISNALRMYRDMLLLKESSMSVLILMNKEYMKLLHIKESIESNRSVDDIAKKSKIPVWIIKNKIKPVSDKLSIAYLRGKVRYGYGLEEKIKTGEISEKIAVELLLVS